jgi:phosphoglycolate phosphatase-like HAD superfamily hydrolase
LLREKELGNIQFPSLFMGDSRYDYIAATKAELDFIFVSGWTEMKDWQEFCKSLELRQMRQITELLELINT